MDMVDAVMRAVRFHRTGGPEVLELEQVPKPVPGEGEVLVRVMAAGVIPYDWKVRKGVIPVPLSFPVIAGYAFAGIVEAAGPGKSGAAPGERVYGRSSRGTYADYTVVKPASMAAMPKSLGFIEAAALQGGATTAWRAVIDGEVKAGDRVLIHGAAGGVGLFAVQFAKARGAYVYGTASASHTLLAAGKLPYRPQPTDVVRFAREQLAAWYPLFEKEGFEVDAALEPFDEKMWNVDPSWFGRILDNLFQNVLRHAKEGRYVGLFTESDERGDAIVIRDRGRRLDGEPGSRGAGLGLSIVDRMVRGMNLEWRLEPGADGTAVRIVRPKDEGGRKPGA
jgi:hypothetical protein